MEVELSIPDCGDARSFADRYADFMGVADDLPADLAENLDQHLHGRGKP